MLLILIMDAKYESRGLDEVILGELEFWLLRTK